MITARWAFNTNQWINSADNWRRCLSAIQFEEVQRVSEFVYANSAVSSLVGRLLLRRWASKCLGLHGSSAQFVRSDKGRPELVLSAETAVTHDFDVNVSHQGDWVVLAASQHGKVGIDVMKVQYSGGKSTSEFFRLMRRQFTADEWSTISSKNDEWAQLSSFYRHWCLKEALVKALGVGIGYNLQKISFKLNTSELLENVLVRDTSVSTDGHRDDDWSFEETMLDAKHSCAVAFLPNDRPSAGTAGLGSAATVAPAFEFLTLSDVIGDLCAVTPVDDELVQQCTKKEFASWL